jgi:hypothetical protein
MRPCGITAARFPAAFDSNAAEHRNLCYEQLVFTSGGTGTLWQGRIGRRIPAAARVPSLLLSPLPQKSQNALF